MENKYNPKNISLVLSEKMFPTVMMWNRLEGSPRTHQFNKALKAEVRDALWMLTKQWQMGEFKADDAGSPVFAKVHISTSTLTDYKAAENPEQVYEKNLPLEVKAEQKKIPFGSKKKEISLDIRLQMGKFWLILLKKNSLNFKVEYVLKYPFELPANNEDSDYIFANKDVWQHYAAIAGRSMDGYKFYEYLNIIGHKASDGIAGSVSDILKIDELSKKFIDWFENQYQQPIDEKNNAWKPEKLEYQFECTATSKQDSKTLNAEEYYQGNLDWYAFDIEQKNNRNDNGKITFTDTFIPTHVKFKGMPDTRWWKFEDGKTSFGDIKTSKTDLSNLLLMEFALVFANDWFVIPRVLPIGSLSNIEGLTVKNNFGETIWIDPTEKENLETLPWSVFKLNSKTQNNTLFLAPSAMKVQQSNPIEEILLIRDEMSNMVWGIETVVPTVFGKGDKGNEVALRTRQFHEKLANVSPIATEYAAKISYLSMNDVPENWIPFVPVHKKDDVREIQLQRASMLREIEGSSQTRELKKIKPLTSILREGLDEASPKAYFIHEEEVSSAGIKVQQIFQRTRWVNGEVFVWLGMKKKIGRGEGSSGLAFDQIKDVI